MKLAPGNRSPGKLVNSAEHEASYQGTCLYANGIAENGSSACNLIPRYEAREYSSYGQAQ